MSNEFEFVAKENNVRVSVSGWDEGGLWISLMIRGGSMYASLSREEAQKLSDGLKTILEQEVEA
jgi:hypothetical protein